jgi:hypothetical protein
MIVRTRFVAILVAIAVSGCSGGGSAVLPGGSPAGGSPGGGSISPASATHAKFTITVPARATTSAREHRAYVSPSTQSVVITLMTVDGSAYTGTPGDIASNLTTSNPNCTGNPLTCTVSAPAAAGTDVFLVATYDQLQTSASPTTPVGNVLSQATLSVAVVANQANTVSTPLILSGAPASFVISGLPAATVGAAFGTPQAFSVNAKDAGGNTIVGSYLHPVTLADSDTSGATTLATSGSDNPSSGTLLSSSDTATLNYNGASLSSATITAAATGATPAMAAFSPTVPTVAITGLSTTTGLIGTTTTATVTGSGFTNSTVVGFSGSGVTVQTTYVNATTLTATIFVDPEAATGARNVTVTAGPAMATLTNGFTISNTGVTVVTLATDTVPGSPAGSGTGISGDLRYAIQNAPAGNTIVFDTTAMGGSTIVLAGPLPPIEQNVTIDGGYYGRVTIDGASAYRAFFVDTGTVSIQNLKVQNALAEGGNGGDNSLSQSSGPGGGGFGAGACVFVNQSTAAVTLDNDYLVHCSAVGGNGGSASANTDYRGGGGGGMGGDGGGISTVGFGGGGGGGVLAAGSAATSGAGGVGGVGGGGGGAGYCSAGASGAGGIAYGSNSAGSAASSSGSGAGGFGGGGGGTSNCSNFSRGANGGFGGGGGGGQSGGRSGNGGVGGGGAGASGGFSFAGIAGSGGAVTSSISGGAGGAAGATNQMRMTVGSPGGGGGGAAVGPAVFVNAGTLTMANSGATNSSATGGLGGAGGASYGSGPSASNPGSNGSGGSADATPVFNYAGTVNGSTVTGPVSGGIGASAPALRRGHVTPLAQTLAPRRFRAP